MNNSRNKKHEKLNIDEPIINHPYGGKSPSIKDYSKTLMDLGIDQKLDHLPSKKW